MSDMVVRGTTFAPGEKGTVDIINLKRADRVPASMAVYEVNENVTAGRDVCGPNPELMTADVWSTFGNEWSPGDDQPVSNGLQAVLTRVASVTVDLGHMGGLDLGQTLTLDVESDGVSTIRLLGSWPGAVEVDGTVQCIQDDAVEVSVGEGQTTVVVEPATEGC